MSYPCRCNGLRGRSIRGEHIQEVKQDYALLALTIAGYGPLEAQLRIACPARQRRPPDDAAVASPIDRVIAFAQLRGLRARRCPGRSSPLSTTTVSARHTSTSRSTNGFPTWETS